MRGLTDGLNEWICVTLRLKLLVPFVHQIAAPSFATTVPKTYVGRTMRRLTSRPRQTTLAYVRDCHGLTFIAASAAVLLWRFSPISLSNDSNPVGRNGVLQHEQLRHGCRSGASSIAQDHFPVG